MCISGIGDLFMLKNALEYFLKVSIRKLVYCILAKSRDYKEGPLHSKSVRCCRHERHGHHVPSQCPKQKHFPPVLVAIFNISGGNEHAIFVMGAMFLASALTRGSHPRKY